jgi:uncharacterized SAM-binding protein YcdF (DUF218 family)
MFFVLAKIFGFFAHPSNVLIVLALVAAATLRTKFATTGRRLLLTSVILLAILGFTPLGNALIVPLEDRFPRWDATRGAPDGIVVLGGAFDTVVSRARGDIALTDAAERMTVVADLARRYPAARILFSGGSGQLVFAGATEAELAARLFASFGIDRQRIILEDRSRDTAENAVYSRIAASPRPGERWLLVTSAYHMPRAVGAFRRANFPVEAYPVDWRTRGPADLARPFESLADGLKRSDTAAREWVGLLLYWLRGRTSELFPGPNT